MKYKWLSILLVGSVLLAACNNEQEDSSKQAPQEQQVQATEHSSHQQLLANGNLQEETASADILPSFLDNQSENLKLVYKTAGQAIDVLKWIPCYCGCADSSEHKNNLNCFIKEVKDDGTVVWDDHGTRCIVCVDTAIYAIKQAQEGQSLKAIRKHIDEQYKEGYSKPTPTPMPS